MLERVDAAATRAERIHRGQVGEVKVGFFGSAPSWKGFRSSSSTSGAEHPDVDLILEEMPTYQQIDAILDGRLDPRFRPAVATQAGFDPVGGNSPRD